MQKVIRRTLLAEKQAARRLAKRQDTSKREQAKSNREQSRYLRKDEVRDIQTARQVRREDWELGPLAPRRDVGSLKEAYGTINSQRTRGTLLNEKEKERLLEPVGGKYLVFSKEDRVVLLEGRDKGKIGKIIAIDTARGECTVEGLNLVSYSIVLFIHTKEHLD
jgi:large subunit ribosomal protein L24